MNAHNPQRAILPLALLAARISELQPALHGFFGGAVQLRFGEEITAGAFQDLFSFRAAFGSAFYTGHSILSFLLSRYWRLEARTIRRAAISWPLHTPDSNC